MRQLTSTGEQFRRVNAPPARPGDTSARILDRCGAFDRDDVYGEVAERYPGAEVIVPPRSGAELSRNAETAPTQRDRHLQLVAERGRMGWQMAG